MTRLFLTSNSPGEVTTFVRPVVAAVQKRHPDWKVQVCLVPCPYATGAEAKVIRSWSESPEVWTPWQTTKAWWKASGRCERGAIVFLGGDPWHALLLKRSFGLPCAAYFPWVHSWQNTTWLGGFDKVALGYAGDGLRVGDLRVDAVRARLAEVPKLEERPLTLALFPGSRWLHLKAVLGPFLKVVDTVAQQFPQLRVVLAASPFVTPERLADAAAKPIDFGLALSRSELIGDTITTEAGTQVEVLWGRSPEVIAHCDLAMSLPGTNTAELAVAGKPTVIPLTARVPVGGGGLLGIVDRLPGLKGLKRRLRESKKRRVGFTALPNQLAGRAVMPEFLIRDDLQDLCEVMADLLGSEEKRLAIGREAQDVMGAPGAADRLLDEIEALV